MLVYAYCAITRTNKLRNGKQRPVAKENKVKLAIFAWAVKQFMKFRLIWAKFLEDGLRSGILVHCVSH